MDKVLQMIGMAKKAGKISTGEYLSEQAIKSGDSVLVIIASDISDRSRKDIVNACKFYNVEYMEYSDKENLGRYTGGGPKAVVSVNDSSFAEAIKGKYSDRM